MESRLGEFVRAIAWLLSLLPGVVTGQVRPRARRVVRGWTKHNSTWKSLGYGPVRRLLFWGSAHPLWFVVAVALVAFGVAYALGVPHGEWPAIVGQSAIDAKYDLAPYVGVPWGVQATVVSLVYPIVLSYVALLLQRRARSATRQHVYQLDSAVVPAGISSLALLLVMSAEYFLVPFLSAEARAKYVTMLLMSNWGWLAFNLVLTGYFVSRTVRFLQDGAQENAFTRVAVAIALKEELRLAMQQHLFVSAPESDWKLGGHTNSEDTLPRVLMFSLGNGKPTVMRRMTGSYVLHDVHLRLLSLVVRRWTRRASNQEGKQSPRICFPPLIGETTPEEAVLCTIENGPALTRLERMLVEGAYVFKRERAEAFTLSTRNMLEEISFEVQTAADARHFDSARDALRRMFRLHETLLLASKSSNEGTVQSVATISTSPYGWGANSFGTEWLRSYRELATAGARLLDDDRRLFEGIAAIPARIADALPAVPDQPVLEGMQVGSSVAHELGAWWTRKADASLATTTTRFAGLLPPPLCKVYEHALTSFVGAWGGLTVDPLNSGSDAQIWDSLRARTVVYARHIDYGAQFFLKAVSRGDAAGAEWLLDAFVKWWGNRQHELDSDDLDDFQARHVTLSLSGRTWEEVQEFLRIDENPVSLETATRALNLGLRRYWENMRLYLAVLLVYYAGETPKPDSRELRLAAALVTGTAQRQGGTLTCDDLKTMDAVLTATLAVLYGVESPEHRINSFAEHLRWDSEAPEVSGWIYSWSGTPTNLLSMKNALVTLMLALPAPRLARATSARRLVESWWRDLDKLSNVATYLADLRRLTLSGGFNAWAPAVQALQAQLQTETRVRTSRRSLARVLSNLRRTAVHERLVTLRSRAVDDARVKRFAAAVSSIAFCPESWLASRGITLRFVPGLSDSVQYFNVEDNKMRYLERLSDEVDSGLGKHAADEIRRFAIALPLRRRLTAAGIAPANAPGLCKNYEASVEEAQALLLAIVERCEAIRAQGQAPAVLVGQGALTSYLNHHKWGEGGWQYPPPPGVIVEANGESGKQHLLSRVNGFPVYRFDTPHGDCYVVPATLMATLVVSGSSPDSVLKVSWELLDDERISIKLSWAGRFE